MEEILGFITCLLLLASLIIGLALLNKVNKKSQNLTFRLMTLSFFFLSLIFVVKVIKQGRSIFATSNNFTFLLAWVILFFFLILNKKIQSILFTNLISGLALTFLAIESIIPDNPVLLAPALQSFWLKFHVLSAAIAYGAFGLSFCIALLSLLRKGIAQQEMLTCIKLNQLMHCAVSVGFYFMTIVLITGAVWAEEVWGRWWSWDPKETWALITWLIYAGYLHIRKTRGWEEKSAILVILGFLIVIFTLFGVSFLMASYHKY